MMSGKTASQHWGGLTYVQYSTAQFHEAVRIRFVDRLDRIALIRTKLSSMEINIFSIDLGGGCVVHGPR